jgi:serine/threonine-protein kinase
MAAAPLPADASGTPRLPRMFGRYALFDFVGKGGMAEIFLARQKTDLGAARLCVVKQILPELADDLELSEMLIHEAKLAARLSHANVVQVLDLGRENDRLFIAMEYVEGFDLNELLRRCSRSKVPLPFEFALHIVSEALRGLDYAHRRTADDGKPLGIVHRDVSPSNVLVSFEGEVKVCDFGIARAYRELESMREPRAARASESDEALKGKAGYMSPEHARGETLDARADVFAAGIVLWEVVAGRRMYRAGEGRPALLDQAKRAEIPELPARNLPEEEKLRAIVSKALAVDREARYASAGAMLREVEAYAATSKLVASPLRLGDWLMKTFGEDIVARRRACERATAALERGVPLEMTLAKTESTPPPSADVAFASVDLSPPSAPLPRTTDDDAAHPSTAPSVAITAVVAVAAVVVLVLLATQC